MKVAICIPTFNRPEYLIQTLDSLLESINGFETIIITDDGSTDKKVFSIIDCKLFGYKNKIIIKHNLPLYLLQNVQALSLFLCVDKLKG